MLMEQQGATQNITNNKLLSIEFELYTSTALAVYYSAVYSTVKVGYFRRLTNYLVPHRGINCEVKIFIYLPITYILRGA